MKDIAIYGAGGFGREVKMLIDHVNQHGNQWNVIGFYDDAKSPGEDVNGLRVLGSYNDLATLTKELNVVIAVGDPMKKKDIVSRIKSNPNVVFPVLIHPDVRMGQHVTIGEGSVIAAGAIITENISIGSHTLVNLLCTIGHDVCVGSFCSLMPGAHISGEVTIEDCVYVGTGAVAINQIKIAEQAIIGAGAVVVTDIPAKTTAVGVPAKPIRK